MKQYTPMTFPLAKTDSVITMSDQTSSWSLGFSSPTISKDKNYPLIIYLHGGIGTDRTDKGSKAWEMFSFILDSFPAVIASPSANRNVPWWSESGIERIFSSIDEMVTRFPIDQSKIFLTGVSDGATGMIAIASLPNHPFAGFLGSSAYPLLFGESLDKEKMKKAPIHLYICGKDRLYNADSVINWCKNANEAGIPISYTTKLNAEHGFDFKYEEKTMIISLFQKWVRQSSL